MTKYKRVEREGKINSDTKIYGINLIMYLCEYNGVMYHSDVLILCIVVLFNYQ